MNADAKIFELGDTRIAIFPIAEGERGTRRQREKAAVAIAAKALLGHDALIDHDQHGAPIIPKGCISISHSRAWAAVAINPRQRIGIDIEEQRDALQRTRERFLSAEEKTWAAPQQLLALWTIKEAVFKAAGMHNLPLTSISTAPDLDVAMISAPYPEAAFTLRTFNISDTHSILTLAMPKK